MWLKLLIIGGLAYFAYRAMKGPDPAPKPRVKRQAKGEIDDVMVQDPFCNVYFPRQEGVKTKVNGKVTYFCSKECMDKFFSQKSK